MRVHSNRLAAWSGMLGGVLGVAAGVAQAVAGSELGAWSGSKADPVPLGMLTVALSVVACGAVVTRLQVRRPSAGHRAAVAAAELVPGLVCFTTVGRLWWVPGVLLLVAAAVEIGAAPADTARVVRRTWSAVLTGLLGVCLAIVASTADSSLRWLGFGCGLAVAVAPWLASRSVPVAAGLLLVGAVPFASITWWTAVTPVAAALALVTGTMAIRRWSRMVGRTAQPADRDVQS